MQALVGLFCFSLILAAATCLECEHCSGLSEDCTGRLLQCNEGQDTCASILTETIIGKVSSFTIVKSCYQASKCLGSSKEYSFIKVHVNIECSSSPAGRMGSEGGKALVHQSNKLPDNQRPDEVFNRPKSRADVRLDLRNSEPKAKEVTGIPVAPTIKPDPPTIKPDPPTIKPDPPTIKPNPPTIKPDPPTIKPDPPTIKPDPPTIKPDPPTVKPDPPTIKPDPPTIKPDPPTIKPDPPTIKPDPPTVKPDPPTVKPDPPTIKPDPPTVKPNPPTIKPDPPTKQTDPPTKQTDASTKQTDATTKQTDAPTKQTDPTTKNPGDNAHQTVASFLLALSSLLLMNILL